MKRPLLIALGAAALGAAGLLSAPTISPLAAQAAPAQAAAVQKTTFSIENMTCAMCPVTVTKAMKGVAGVKSVTVDFAAKTVICPLLSGPISILGMAMKEEWNGKEAQAGRHYRQAA